MTEASPLFWPVQKLTEAYAARSLSPVEVTQHALDRIGAFNGHVNAYLAVTADLALDQAKAAEQAYRSGRGQPLSGVPVSIKDLFDVEGAPTTYGSRAYLGNVAARDSGAVRRLRGQGAVFLGKTNTAEFGQSGTTENLLGPPARNPWDLRNTTGGSSGGAAASVAAGLASVALGSDGGGSLRIPGSFTGLVGLKPSYGLCLDENGFQGMSRFACPGPLARRVADARLMLEALAGKRFEELGKRPLRVAFCATLEGRPVDRAVAEAVDHVRRLLERSGHSVVEAAPPIGGWNDAFDVLVPREEWMLRASLLDAQITDYEASTLRAGSKIAQADEDAAMQRLRDVRLQVADFFQRFDLVVLPATAVPAFPIGRRPRTVNGQRADRLWGAFPFTPMFNVAGTPAMSMPCGLAGELPVGVQLVAAQGGDALLLDVAAELEALIGFDASAIENRWRDPDRMDGVRSWIGGGIGVVELHRPDQRNALSRSLLSGAAAAVNEMASSARAVVLTGAGGHFSGGFDLGELTGTAADVDADAAIETLVSAIDAAGVPVVAAVEGHCIGAAFEVALSCDAVVAARDARFSLPATRLGLLYRPRGLARLLRDLGRLVASRLLLLNETLSGEDLGAARMVDNGKARDAAVDLAVQCLDAKPDATAATKRFLRARDGNGGDWERERLRLLSSPERAAAVSAARGKRQVGR